MALAIIVAALAAYLLGNLNGAVSMSVLFGDDVRTHGSGNAGLTNFVRTFGKRKAGLVLLIDIGKAVIACFVGKLLLEPYGLAMEGAMLGAIAVTLGHDFPALLGFRGGKGILCGVTVAAVLDWRCAVVIFGIFAIIFTLTHYVSLGSVFGAIAMSIYFAVVYYDNLYLALGGVLLGLLAVFMHRANIVRLLKGKEGKMYLGKKEK